MLIRKIPVYDFGELALSPIKNTDFLKDKFYISFPSLPAFCEEKTLLSVGGALTFRVICRSFTSSTPDIVSVRREECFYFNDTDEWMLEAECRMQTTDGEGQDSFFVRLPLSAPFAKAPFGFVFDGVWLRFVQNGRVLNENAGFDCFVTQSDELFVSEEMKGAAVARLEGIDLSYVEEKSDASMGLYFPDGWNTSIGDVMNFAHDGTYHVIYLLDRRHHGSRGGMGAHYLAHLTTKNLVDWYEEEPIVRICESWQSYGTGTMLYADGQYYMAYGLHSERYPGACLKREPRPDEKTGAYAPLSVREVLASGALPAGATYAVSEDGRHFTPSDVLFHEGRNPSVYVDENGEIDLFVGYGGDGCFHAKNMNAPFYRSAFSYPYARRAQMKNTTECPSFFTFGGYKYLIVGFTGYYRTLSPDSTEYVDAHARGECIYDGLGVPMVAAFGERRLMAGWVPGLLGWGGAMMQRELIAEEGGVLGMKWIPELAPTPVGEELSAAWDGEAPLSLPEKKSFLLDLSVDGLGERKLSLVFSDGEKSCVLWLDGRRERVGFADTSESEIPTDFEQLSAFGDSIDIYPKAKLSDIARNAHNYTLSGIKGTDTPFTLRIASRYSRRMRATVFDVEIAKRRTLISVRTDFYPTRLSLLSNGGKVAVAEHSLHLISESEM